ncbi:uncharacterized protein LOC130441883 isoform X1 [Diorhabda sublineata]|uniref:uncharacterized protein LOC130441883 isoform X1 n=2 Tax=Diorhabda sublineata TaxID=1163346 RepID=UPI0024E0BE75|nr:uncharacterized protein LOC130441883 isoform X1 [Diorhabda sublineata]XP_056631687.1 uncharacterized protein LOC130441883 isoform X1 [Diorhabda sublineata]
MSEEEYNKKLEALQEYLPFLNNMISQLKDPNKKNREQQLSKMESLHAMITDKKKKLKIDTLNKCEDVISKLYLKVNHKPFRCKSEEKVPSNPSSPLAEDCKDYFDIKPIPIPTERVKGDTRIHKIDVYSSAAESITKSKLHETVTSPDKLHDFSKPPISLEDLKCLEVDVQEKINETATLKELNDLRNKITTELIFEKIKSMNSTETNQDCETSVHKTELVPSRSSSSTEQNKGEKKKKHDRKSSPLKEKKSEKYNDQSKERRSSKEDKKKEDLNFSKNKPQEKISSVLEKAMSENNYKKHSERDESVVKDVGDRSIGHMTRDLQADPRIARNQPIHTNAPDNRSNVSVNSKEAEYTVHKQSSEPVYKRLADKYNRKPRKPIIEPDVDKIVEDSIEQNMIHSPPLKPAISNVVQPPPPPASLVKCSQLEPEFPHQLNLKPPMPYLMPNKNVRVPLLSTPRTDVVPIPPLLSPRDNFVSNPPILMSPRDNFAPGPSNCVPMSPMDNFESDYVREDFNFNNQRRPRFEPPPSLLSLNVTPPTANPRFNPSFNNYNANRYDSAPKLDFQPSNHSLIQYNAMPPHLSPEVPNFPEHKPYGIVKREMYLPKDDLRWRLEDSRPWERRGYEQRFRGPTTYKEHREIRENSRDPRLARDTRENRELRDPRLNRDKLNVNEKPTRERENKESTEKDNKDPRLNRDSQRSNIRENQYKSKFDRLYSRTNEDQSRSRSPTSKIKENDSFSSPLDSLYTTKEEHKTGKGYGVQCFRIPKKKKEDKEQKEEIKKDDEKDAPEQGTIISECDSSHNIDQCKDDSLNENNSKSIENEKTDSDCDNIEDKNTAITTTTLLSEPTEAADVDAKISELKKDAEVVVLSNEEPNKSSTQTKAEADQKPKSDNTDIQTSSKGEELSNFPAEQRILAQFFANLLGSKDKKEKKTALYSLITTFSDTFSKETMSSISRIINTDKDDSSEEDEQKKMSKKEDDKEEDKLKEEEDDDKCDEIEEKDDSKLEVTEENDAVEDKTNTVETEEISTIPKRKLRNRRRSASTTKQNLSETTNDEKEIQNNLKQTENSEELDVDQDNEVLVTVGERIKSRKRTATLADKPKKKCRSELDKLHEDIQEMFIRDGVLTASGKRMCHILKTDPSVLDTGNIDTESEEVVKTRKKAGRKPKNKSPITNDVKTMKTVRVVIHKIPDAAIEESSSNRRLTRSMTSPESDEEGSFATETSVKDHSDVESSTYNDSEHESLSQSFDNQKIKMQKRKRPRSSWASGIIKKKKKKQSAEESQQKYSEFEEPAAKETFIAPEKDHYVDFINQKSYKCRLCDFQGKYIASHYKIVHPDSEVMCSRFTPSIAMEALADAKMNMEKYERYQIVKTSAKISYICRFCTFSTSVMPTFFYDHITTHTGEYRHHCPNCYLSFCSSKTLNVHMSNNHKGSENPIVRKSYSSVIIFGYLCGECNYVQMNKRNIEEHINIYHLKKPPIHKVNMTSSFDEAIVKLFNEMETTKNTAKTSTKRSVSNTSDSHLQTELLDDVNEEVQSPHQEKKPRITPGPKSKKKQQVTSNTQADIVNKELDSTKVTNIRRSIDDIDPEKILPFRCKRAAKEKAQEKLKELMELSDNVRKEKINDVNQKENTELSKNIDECETNEETKQESAEISKLDEPPKLQPVKKEIDMNVFTCKTDIQEENKKIEQERLLKMEELNKSVGSRTSLNFIDALCHRLNQNEVIIKQEPNDDFIDAVHQTIRVDSPVSMPILEKNPTTIKAASSQIKKPILERDTHVSTPKFDVSQKNDKSIVDVIEKLKGKLSADDNFNIESNNEEDNEGPPPLTHVNELTNIMPVDDSIETLEICGLIKLIKSKDSVTFCCLVPPCVYSTEHKEHFRKHCQNNHSSNTLRSSLCEICGVQITSGPDTNLLENIFNHTIKQHADFIGHSKPLIRMIRLRKLSGDALSVVNIENEIDNNVNKTEIESSDSTTVDLTDREEEEDNPFPFKISGVMSLADPEPQPPPLTPIMKPNMQIVVKEAKLTPAELAKSKKSEKAIKKFIEEVDILYKCPHYYCLFMTYFRYSLEIHLKSHNLEKDSMVPCVYCDLKTPWEHVAVHIDIRHANCKYACSHCLYRACLKDYVLLHQERVHPSQNYSVITVATPKIQKKFAIADVKIDPKTLCSPYVCQTNCNLQFLFENEFREHVMSAHHHNTFITCGHELCSSRVKPSKIVQHWSVTHDVSVYQCGYCKTNSNELHTMYHHLSQVHQNLNPEILVRLVTPKPTIPLGYSTEAFRRMRKIATIHYIPDGDKIIKPVEHFLEASNTSTHFTNTMQVVTTSTKTVIITNSSSTVTTSANNLFLVTSTSTGTNSSSLPPPSLVNISSKKSLAMSPINQSAAESSNPDLPLDPLEIEEYIPPSIPATIEENPNITLLHPIETQIANVSSGTNIPENITKNPNIDGSLLSSSNMVPLEHINLNEDNNRNDSADCDIDPLDLGESLTSQSIGYSSEDESDNGKSKKKCGLLGYQLFRCAFCDFSCTNVIDFKRHISKSVRCKSDNRQKPFMCVHCKKHFKNPHPLGEHIQCHGVLRFNCSLCGNKFPSSSQARGHMKHRHNISQTTQTALNPEEGSPSNQEYIIKPKFVLAEEPPKENTLAEPPPSLPGSEQIYLPDEIEKIPIRSIFSSDLKCGVCSYTTKVRTNMVRHLQFHSEEKSVPDTAPVNPVPCLEKNEKMFDKMINLASSSHSSKMGTINKSEVKDIDINVPHFVPSHTRYTCCAQDCNYICPEEANLRHHLIALHSEESSFICVHCKVKLTAIDADGLIRHLKLHGLQLYKCHYCNYLSNLKHKVEKHCNDVHIDLQVKTTTVRYMESEPKDSTDDDGKSVTFPTILNQTKLNKPWRCCMCKTRSGTQEGIQNHVLEKHDIDSQYKCALCIYKTNDKSTFTEHFKQEHNNQDINIVYVYRKIEDEPKDDKDSDSFDTTPLWQRDRPRVRHIRGILFDESLPVTSKSSKKSVKPPPPIPTSVIKSSANLDLSINAVATGSVDVTKNIENNLPKKEKTSEVTNVIVIDDDIDVEPVVKTIEHAVEASVENEYSEMNLINLFGDFGQPLNKQLKCPVCNNFKSKRISDVIFHLFKEKRVYRYKCGICGDETITYRYMAKHVREHKQEFDLDNIITMPRNPKLEIWLQMLIRIQCVKIIASLSAPADVPVTEKHKVLCRYCNKWYRNEQERNEHAIFHWNCIPFKCSLCSFNSFTRSSMMNHFNETHVSENVPSIVEAGPTVAGELQYADFLHVKEIEEEMAKMKSAAQTFKKTSIAEVLVPEVIIPNMIDESEQDGTVQGMSCEATEVPETNFEITDNVNDLVVVTKTDTNVPRAGDVFCCEYCPYMSDSEMLIVSHISSQHEHMHVKFKILNQDKCERKLEDYVACVICSEMGSEIKIRQHYLEVHEGETFGIYRYTCCSCRKRFFKMNGLKMHFQRIHPGVPVKYISILENLIESQPDKLDLSLNSRSALASSSQKTWKHYQCTECSYERNFTGSSVGNVRAHMRNHFRAFICKECGSNFRSKTDALSHCRKEHSQSTDNIIHAQDIEDRFQSALRTVLETAVVVPNPDSPNTTSIHTTPLQVAIKQTARKSTSSSSQVNEYSFYGGSIEDVDLNKIMTSVEMNGVCLQMNADKLGKIFDLNPFVGLERCDALLDNTVIDYDS